VSGRVRVATVRRPADLGDALDAVDLGTARPVLVLIGGAGGLTRVLEDALRDVFAGCLSPLVQQLGAAIVDGGTESGVMRLIGRARAAAGHDYPLVGVAAAGTIGSPGGAVGSTAPIDPDHSHLVIVPGERWGDESPWLKAVAVAIARDRGRVALLVNGGRVAHDEAMDFAASGIPVVVVAGSGRAADTLAARLERERGEDGLAGMIRVELVDVTALRTALETSLAAPAP